MKAFRDWDLACKINAAILLFLLVAGGLIGGLIGGRLFKNVPNTWLRRIFALFLLYGAARYLL